MTSASWFIPTLIATVLWGLVGVLQKLGSNRVNASSLLAWVMVGYVLALPVFWRGSGLAVLSHKALFLGILAGAANGLGTWFLFAALERGAKASVAIPLTALYPLITVALAYLALGERLGTREWVAVMLALCAGAMLSYETDTGMPASGSN
jgi:transporter family protein